MRIQLSFAIAMAGLVAMLSVTLVAGVVAAPPAAAGQPGFLSKTASTDLVPASGGDVTFTLTTQYFATGGTMVSLVDSEFGALDLSNSTCDLPVTDFPYTCEFTRTLTPDNFQPHINTATAEVMREFGNDSLTSFPAFVSFEGISVTKTAFPSSLPAAGGDVMFDVTVTNQGSTVVRLDSLVDDIFGDLDGVGTCSMPQPLRNGGDSYTCSFTQTLGPGSPDAPHLNTVTAGASGLPEEDGQEGDGGLAGPGRPITAQASATVTFVTTGITASKSAAPTSLPESGGDVTFTYGVTNVGDLDVIVDTLLDDKLGDLGGQGDCVLGQTVAAGATYTCTVTKTLSGTADTPHVNTFTANATTIDTTTLEENSANATAAHQATAMATVTFVAPAPTATPVPPTATPVPSTPVPTATPVPTVVVGSVAPTRPVFVADPTPVPTVPTVAAAAPAQAAATTEVKDLAFTSSESTIPLAMALSAISGGALLLGWLRRREDQR